MNESAPTLYLIDGHSQLFRAFYAIRRLSNSQGLPTNMVFGFLQILNKLLADYEPRRIAVVFDAPGPTFRNEIYDQYKANRPPAPEDFGVQVPYVKRLLEAYGVPTLERRGFEADDIIATLARRASDAGQRVLILSSDKDLFQLVDDAVQVLSIKGNRTDRFDREKVKEKMGVWPEQVLDLLGLMGDSSDNIPGISGVGPKTAVKLLEQFGGMDAMFERAAEIKNVKQREKILAHREDALLSRRLATLDYDVELACEWEGLRRGAEDRAELARLFHELEFAIYQKRYPLEEAGGAAAAARESPAAEIPVQYVCVDDEEELARWCERFARAELLALDTETDGLDPQRADLIGISLSAEPGVAIYIPVAHATLADPQIPLERIQALLGPVLADAGVPKAAQNAKFDLAILGRHGLPVRGVAFDTMIASYLLDPDASHGLKNMAREQLGETMTEIKELIGSGQSQRLMSDVPVAEAADYACQDADMTLRLARLLRPRIDESPMRELFYDVELPLVDVLLRMETSGVAIDAKYFAGLSREFQQELETLARKIYDVCGKQFAINSPKQVGEILFEDLGLPTTGVKRGKSGAYSTDVSVLEMLKNKHPLPKLLLEFRMFEKLKNTYVDPLPNLRHPRTRRIHTSYNQTVASTGRLSSSNPNLQNIPIRTRHGRVIRRGFVPSAEGNVLLAADYSQIELRLLAHISRDESLVRAFTEGDDIHRLTASKVFGVEPADVTKEMRGQSKVVNFGIIYGMSAHRLAGELEIPRAQAKQFIDDYFAAYPGVRTWIETIVAQARELGYVETLLRRRRYVPDINSRNHNLRAAAERVAVNTPIQGSSADMIKVAMIRIDRALQASDWRARMILQVHDELIFDLPEAEVEAVRELVRRELESALPLSVPVVADFSIGRNWEEC